MRSMRFGVEKKMLESSTSMMVSDGDKLDLVSGLGMNDKQFFPVHSK